MLDDILANSVLLPMYQHWKAISGQGTLPPRGKLDPVCFSGVLSSAWIYRYLPDEGDFVCELAGEDIKDNFADPTIGNRISVLTGDSSGEVVERMKTALLAPLIIYGRSPPRVTASKLVERLLLPMSDDTGEPLYLFGATLYKYANKTLRGGWQAEDDIPWMAFYDVDNGKKTTAILSD